MADTTMNFESMFTPQQVTDESSSATEGEQAAPEGEQAAPEGEQVHLGRVKWFNSRQKYGFLIDLSDAKEIFVHLDDIHPLEDLSTNPHAYKTLYTGEYCQFNIAPSDAPHRDDSTPRFKAVNVTGIKGAAAGGTLLCDMGKLRFFEYSRMQFTDRDPHGTSSQPPANGGDTEGEKKTVS
jgi:cold shock CspA family protein